MRLLILATDCDQTTILYNHLKDKYIIEKVIIENKISKWNLIKFRLKKLGIIKVLDQLLFLIILNRLIHFFSKKRINEIIYQENLNFNPIPEDKIMRVANINSIQSIELTKTFNVDCYILSGTRIISNKFIQSSVVDIINLHAGITPDYRGVHGAYWAKVNYDLNAVGVTLHYVDKGVDTGQIINQEKIKFIDKDNISTYPYLQIACGLYLIDLFFNGSKSEVPRIYSSGKSNQFFHPGFFEYCCNFLFKGVK